MNKKETPNRSKEKSRKRRKVRSDKIKLSNEQINDIEGFSAIGLTQEQIAHILGVSPDTIQRRIKEGDSRITEAISRGKSLAIGNVAKKAYELAIGGNSAMIKYYLAIHNGWHEKPTVNICGSPPDENKKEETEKEYQANIIEHMSREEKDEMIELLERQEKLEQKVKERFSP